MGASVEKFEIASTFLSPTHMEPSWGDMEGGLDSYLARRGFQGPPVCVS